MCLGPVTHSGCNALCPSYNRGCFGCYGPMDSPNTSTLSAQFRQMGYGKSEIMNIFRNYNCYAEAFRKESEANEK